MKKTCLIAVIIAFIAAGPGANFAAASGKDSKAEKQARIVERMKTGLQKLGTGEAARIEVKLNDKSRVSGYVKEIGDTGFTVVDLKSGAETVVPYNNARQIKGNNLSTGMKIAIGLAILAAVLGLLLFFENYG